MYLGCDYIFYLLFVCFDMSNLEISTLSYMFLFVGPFSSVNF
jgi:hypothetical protein